MVFCVDICMSLQSQESLTKAEIGLSCYSRVFVAIAFNICVCYNMCADKVYWVDISLHATIGRKKAHSD